MQGATWAIHLLYNLLKSRSHRGNPSRSLVLSYYGMYISEAAQITMNTRVHSFLPLFATVRYERMDSCE